MLKFYMLFCTASHSQRELNFKMLKCYFFKLSITNDCEDSLLNKQFPPKAIQNHKLIFFFYNCQMLAGF